MIKIMGVNRIVGYKITVRKIQTRNHLYPQSFVGIWNLFRKMSVDFYVKIYKWPYIHTIKYLKVFSSA